MAYAPRPAWASPIGGRTLIAGYCIGAFANHAMFVVIHDGTHNLVFKKRGPGTRSAVILADLPNADADRHGLSLLPRETPFSHLGDYDYDADLASALGGRSRRQQMVHEGRLVVLLRHLPAHPAGTAEGHRADVEPLERPTISSRWAPSISAIVYGSAASTGCVYLSRLVLVLGRRPASATGARWVQEHYTFDLRAGDLRLLRAAQPASP